MKKHITAVILLIIVLFIGMAQPALAANEAPKGIALDTQNETVTGVSNLMEYSTNGTKWTAIAANPLNITSLIPSATASRDVTLSIRFKAASGNPASQAANIALPRRSATPTTAAVKLDGFSESISATDLMEYRIGSSGSFTAVAAGNTKIHVNVGSSSQSYQVRIKATNAMFASATRSVSVPARKAAPKAVYNGSTDRITGVSTSMEYSLNNGTSWTSVTATYLTRSVFGNTAATVMVRTKASATAPSSTIISISVPGAATTTPTGIALDTRTETVTGVSNLMEYSTNGTKWTAITSNTLNIASQIPAATARADVSISIRLKAANGNPASLPTDIILPRRPATPPATTVKYDGFTETISATDLMEFRAGSSGAFTAVATGSTKINTNAGASSQSYQVRVKATDSTFASATRSVSVPARRAAPNAVYNGSTDRVTGVSTAMEYSLNSGTSWTSLTATYLPRSVFGNDAATVMVRSKATAAAPSSNIRNVTIPGAATTSPTGFAIDARNETVTGVSNLMEYSTNGTKWTAITSNTLNITSLIPAATATGDVTLSIRLKTAGGNPASLPHIINLPKRPVTPAAASVRFDGGTESIIITDVMEYRVGTTGNYIAVPAGETKISITVESSSQSYQVRVKATETTFVSATPLTVTVPARGAAPNAAYNGSTDTITGVSTAMEYSLDDGKTWTSATGTTIPRSVFGNTATTVIVRTKATEAAPVSGEKNVSVPNAATTYPTGIVLDTFSETVTGVSNLMEYSTNGTSWTAISGSTMTITSLVQADSDVTLKIRYMEENGEPASLATNVILPRRTATPTATAVRFDGITESVTVTDLMEYRVGTAGSFTAVPAGETRVSISIGASSQSWQVRVRATSSTFASSALTITAPARVTAPYALFDGSVDMITGVSTAMEYSLNSGSSWTSVAATTIPRSSFGNVATTVMVRVRATATTPSSNIRSVAVPGKGEKFPTGIALDTRNETVTGVSSLMEYTTNGTTWTTIAANPLDISSLIPAANATGEVILKIRYRAAGGDPVSFAISIFLPGRPAAPADTAVKFDGITESIMASSLIEFRSGTTGSFTAVPPGDTKIPVIVGTTSKIYQVRFKATDSTFVSATLTVMVPARATAPNAAFNSTQNVITGVSTAMEYSLNKGATWTTAASTTIPRSVFGNAATTVMVRVKATATAPSSTIKEVEVPRA